MAFTIINVLVLIFLQEKLIFSSGFIINLPNGKINGTADITRSNTIFYSFYGLRYAQPPVGNLRLEPPQAELPWNDIYDATVEKNICYQVTRDTTQESEDCLFANVHTPKNLAFRENMVSDLPVMLYIHGGGFIAGSGLVDAWGPKFFMDYGVILVTFNYRLGPFGFLSTGDHILPGNMGLKDQVALLKWVQKNIRYFGGDPAKVTIFGESSGGGSVGYLVLSPLAKGLFRAAIHQSGSGLSPLAYQRNQANITYLTAAQINAQFSNYSRRNSTELLAFLKSVSSKELDAASRNVTDFLGSDIATPIQLNSGFYYAPVIESRNCKDAFITDKMYNLFEKGLFNKVPVILGTNGDEALGLMNVPGVVENVSKNYDNHPTYLVSSNMHIFNDSIKETVGKIIRSHFTDNTTFETSPIYAVNFHTSHNIDKPVIKQAELQAKYVPVRVYQFNYHGNMGNNKVSVFPGTSNVSHGEELNYFFSRSYGYDIPDNTDLTKFSEEDRIVHKRLMTMWTNFAKYLDPTPENDTLFDHIKWKAVEPENFKFLNIGKDLKVDMGIPKNKNYEFWNNIYEEFAEKPYDTY